MLQTFKEIDVALFLFFNQLHHSILDVFFYWVSNKFVWIPLYIYLLWYLYKKEKRAFGAMVIALILAITLSDQLASTVLKNQVMRMRPCHDPELVHRVHIVNGYCGGLYGFVSSHAANSFALVAFVFTILRGQVWAFRYYLLLWACLHSYSRIYLGVHFPGDILGGAILGSLVGWSLAKSYMYYKTLRYPVDTNSNSALD
jgi:undecaprenyl-diphosphatase